MPFWGLSEVWFEVGNVGSEIERYGGFVVGDAKLRSEILSRGCL